MPISGDDTPVRDATFVVVDIETTGFDPAADSVLEVAARRLGPDGHVIEYESLVRYAPAVTMPPETLVGFAQIPAGGLAVAPMITDVLIELGKFMLDAVPVAHYASFEQRFLRPRGMPIGTSVCTVKLGRKVIALPSYKLERLALALGCPHVPTHRAMTDVAATAWVLEELLTRGGMWQSWTVGQLLSTCGVSGGRQ